MVTEALAKRVSSKSNYVETSERDWLLGLAKSEDGKSFVAELRRKNGTLAEVASRQLLVAEARLKRTGIPPSKWARIREKLLAYKIYIAVGCFTVLLFWLITFAGAIAGLRHCCHDGGRSSFSSQTTCCWISSLFVPDNPASNKQFKVCF